METIPAIQALSVEEKLLLAGEIWREASAAVGPISSETAALLDERIAAYRDRPQDVLTTEQVTENLRHLKERLVVRQK
ncbi:addiction module protein [Chthoniobacter flavus]|uniref:addiction module protein n=1 Tax=Chthoniobacter flavus TaxID=191863 RepID=UPI0012FB42D9|nr:addiction module protein [Chthoniobacter flavus]